MRELVCLLWLGAAANAQTQIDLRTQVKNVDFSNAGTTRPFKKGIVLPATCAPGEAFFKADVSPGSNLYLCVAANQWTQVSGGSLPAWTAGTLLSGGGP